MSVHPDPTSRPGDLRGTYNGRIFGCLVIPCSCPMLYDSQRSSNSECRRIQFMPAVHNELSQTESPSNLLIKTNTNILQNPSLPNYLTLGNTGLRPTASATHPPIKQSPPSGVTGPMNLNRCGSSTSRYILPLNMVMPAVRSDMAMVFCGAATAARVRTAEWMSCVLL